MNPKQVEMNPRQVEINPEIIKNAKLILCDCGGALFSEKIMLKKISSIISPTGKEEVFPMNVLVCNQCGKIPTELNPGNMIPEEYLAVTPEKSQRNIK